MEQVTITVDSPEVVTVQPTVYEGPVTVEVGVSGNTNVEVTDADRVSLEVTTPETVNMDVSTLGAPGLMGTAGQTGPKGDQGDGFNDDPGDFLLIYENGQV